MSRPFLLERLPEHMAEDPFLRRFLGIFQAQADVLVHQLDTLDHVADPTVTSPEMVRFLGSWLGMLTIDPTMPVARQRALVRTAGRVLTVRGTATGLRRQLEALTGATVVVTDNGGIHAEGEAPRQIPRAWVDVGPSRFVTAAHLLSAIQRELPAGVELEVRFGGTLLTSPSGTWTGPEPTDPPDPGPVRPGGAAS